MMKSKMTVKGGNFKLPSIKTKKGRTGNEFKSDDEGDNN